MNDSEASQITISAGHDEPCHMCGESCDGLAGNPGKWPIMLPVEGIPRWHHTGCVATRLKDQADEIKRLKELAELDEWIASAFAGDAREMAESTLRTARALGGHIKKGGHTETTLISAIASQFLNQAASIDRLTKNNEIRSAHNCKQAKRIEDLCEALTPFASGYNLFYRDEPDDRILSLGHWVEHDGDPLPTFYGDVALDVGMVRRAYHLLHPDRQGDRTEEGQQQTAVEPNHPLTTAKESP